MTGILMTTSLAAALSVGILGLSSSAQAQDSPPVPPAGKECIADKCPGDATRGNEQGAVKKRVKTPEPRDKVQQDNQAGDQVLPRQKRAQGGQQNDDDAVERSRIRTGESKWRYDPGRHERRRSKDATFRFYFGGYWYPQPYWDLYSVGPRYRISCGEGRGIVSERFNRVRVVECSGGTYTYLGRRDGDTYRILVNSRTGRIVGRTLI